MTSGMALDGVTSFSCIKDVCETVLLLEGFLQCNGGKLEEAEDFSLKLNHIVYCEFESK